MLPAFAPEQVRLLLKFHRIRLWACGLTPEKSRIFFLFTLISFIPVYASLSQVLKSKPEPDVQQVTEPDTRGADASVRVERLIVQHDVHARKPLLQQVRHAIQQLIAFFFRQVALCFRTDIIPSDTGPIRTISRARRSQNINW